MIFTVIFTIRSGKEFRSPSNRKNLLNDEYVYFNLADGTMITLPKHDKENIQFEDLQVKAICCKNWDANNDGELSYAEAAAVTDIGAIFKGNTNIIAFTELKYFTGIIEIPGSAFKNCTALWKIVLPENVQSIGASAFYGCIGIFNIYLPSKVKTIGEFAFEDCTSLVKINIPNSVTILGASAFCNCSGLTNATIIGNGVTKIGEGSFRGCTSLKSVILGDGVVEIGAFAFGNCILETITIPTSVTVINESAFNCTTLTTIYCKPTTPPTPAGRAFYNNANGRTIYVPTASVDAYKSADNWKDYADQIEGYNF